MEKIYWNTRVLSRTYRRKAAQQLEDMLDQGGKVKVWISSGGETGQGSPTLTGDDAYGKPWFVDPSGKTFETAEEALDALAKRWRISNKKISKIKPQFKIKQLQNWEDENNFSTEDLIKEYFNVRDAEIDRKGDVWIKGPGGGNWLDDDHLEDFLKWAENSRFSSQKKIAEELLYVAKELTAGSDYSKLDPSKVTTLAESIAEGVLGWSKVTEALENGYEFVLKRLTDPDDIVDNPKGLSKHDINDLHGARASSDVVVVKGTGKRQRELDKELKKERLSASEELTAKRELRIIDEDAVDRTADLFSLDIIKKADDIDELNRYAKKKRWEWNRDSKMMFGGYWTDRHGNAYLIT